jgi:hypothetical protein
MSNEEHRNHLISVLSAGRANCGDDDVRVMVDIEVTINTIETHYSRKSRSPCRLPAEHWALSKSARFFQALNVPIGYFVDVDNLFQEGKSIAKHDLPRCCEEALNEMKVTSNNKKKKNQIESTRIFKMNASTLDKDRCKYSEHEETTLTKEDILKLARSTRWFVLRGKHFYGINDEEACRKNEEALFQGAFENLASHAWKAMQEYKRNQNP